MSELPLLEANSQFETTQYLPYLPNFYCSRHRGGRPKIIPKAKHSGRRQSLRRIRTQLHNLRRIRIESAISHSHQPPWLKGLRQPYSRGTRCSPNATDNFLRAFTLRQHPAKMASQIPARFPPHSSLCFSRQSKGMNAPTPASQKKGDA